MKCFTTWFLRRLRGSEARETQGVAQIDVRTGRICRVNRPFCEMVGRSAAELRSLTLHQLFPEESVFADVSRVCQYSTEKCFRRKDGSERRFSVSLSQVRNKRGPPTFLIAELREAPMQKWEEARESPVVGDASGENLRDIIDVPSFQSLLAEFQPLANVALTVVDLQGRVVVATGWRDICSRYHRMNPDAARNCLESDIFLTRKARQGDYVSHKCENNLWEAVTPFFIAGKHVGNIFAGQFLYEDERFDESVFARQAEQYGFEKKAYLAAVRQVPVVSREKIRFIMCFLAEMSSVLSRFSFSNWMLAKSISEQKKAEVALRRSEQKFRQLTEHAPVPIAIYNDFGAIEFVNDRFAETFGYTLSDIPRLSDWLEKGYPNEEYRREVTEAWEGVVDAARKGQRDFPVCEFEVTSKNGAVRTVEIFGSRIGDQNVVIFNDVTARKQAERIRDEEKNKANQYLEIAGVMFGVLNTEGVVELINPKGCRILGREAQEVVGKNWFEMCIPERMRSSARSMFHDLISEKGRPSDKFESPVVCKDGVERVVLFHNTVIKDRFGKVTGAVFSGEDITDQRSLEEQLRHSQKMEAVGLFAGGVAHDFNNILTVILGYCNMMQMRMDAFSPERAHVDQIASAADRASHLTRSLLAFGRKQVMEPQVVNLNQVICGVEKMFEENHRRGIRTENEIEERFVADLRR